MRFIQLFFLCLTVSGALGQAPQLPSDKTTRPISPSYYRLTAEGGKLFVTDINGTITRAATSDEVLPYQSVLLTANSLISYAGTSNSLAVVDGRRYSYSATSGAEIDGITSLMATGKGGGRWILDAPDRVCMWWGFPSIQAALNAGAKYRVSTYLSASATYGPQSFTVDLTNTSLLGDNTTVLGDGRPVICNATGGGNPYRNQHNRIEGVNFACSSYPNTTTAINVESKLPPHTADAAQFRIKGVNAFQCGTGIRFGDNAYIVTVSESNFHSNGVNVLIADGVNAGEKIVFEDCTLFNSALNYRNTNPNSAVTFKNCSFDYSTRQMECLAGRTWVTGGHVEAGTYTAPPFYISGDGVRLELSQLWSPTMGTVTAPYFFSIVNASNGGVFFHNNALNNLNASSGFMASITGTGRFVARDNSGQGQFQGAWFTTEQNNLAIGGDFEDDAFIGEVYAYGTGGRTSNTQATNCLLELSSTWAKSGSKSMKVTKQYGPGSESVFRIYIPIKPNQLTSMSYWFHKPAGGSSTGTVAPLFRWVKSLKLGADGIPIPIYTGTEMVPTAPLTINSSAIDGEVAVSPRLSDPQAHWLEVSTNNFNWNANGDSYYIDRLRIDQL